MSRGREIQSHIGSVQETRKITNAMYLIASARLRQARADLENTRPYFQFLRGEITTLLCTGGIDSRFFREPDPESPGVCGCLVITADRGLAGSYNQNVIRTAEQLRAQHPGCRLFVVGEYGRHYFAAHRIPVEHSFLYTAQNPTLARAREITNLLLEEFTQDILNEIYLVYTDMQDGMTIQPLSTRLLPFYREDFDSTGSGGSGVDIAGRGVPGSSGRNGNGGNSKNGNGGNGGAVSEPPEPKDFEFIPSRLAVLDGILESYLSGFLYSALVYSFCCEQHARMTAMDTATRNADDLLADLSLEYNRVRQADITQELTEISAGTLAQRRKHGKEG